MITVDTSALVAIAGREPDRRDFELALHTADEACISAINYVEAGIVLTQRRVMADIRSLDVFLTDLSISVRNDLPLAGSALAAYLRYGKGIHPARLNLADCFAYALAKQLDAPLLYKGDDFAQTDIRSALQPT